MLALVEPDSEATGKDEHELLASVRIGAVRGGPRGEHEQLGLQVRGEGSQLLDADAVAHPDRGPEIPPHDPPAGGWFFAARAAAGLSSTFRCPRRSVTEVSKTAASRTRAATLAPEAPRSSPETDEADRPDRAATSRSDRPAATRSIRRRLPTRCMVSTPSAVPSPVARSVPAPRGPGAGDVGGGDPARCGPARATFPASTRRIPGALRPSLRRRRTRRSCASSCGP